MLLRELMLLFSHSVMSDSLQAHGLQHTRLPCPSPPHGAWPNTSIQLVMPSSHLVLYHPRFLLSSIFPSIRVFSNESVLGIRWPKYLSFSLSISSGQFRSVTQSCMILCHPMDCSTPGLPVRHQLPDFTQTHVHWVGDAIQPSHPLLSPFSPAFNLSQNQGLFQWVSSSHQVAKVLEFQLQYQSFQWIFRNDFL